MKIQPFKLLLFIYPALFFFSCSGDRKNPKPEPSFSLLSQIDITGFTADIWGYEVNGKEYVIVANWDTETEEQNITIVDVTDPLAPSIASTLDLGGLDVKVWNNYLYVAQGSNTDGAEEVSQIIDISDPLNPIVVGGFPAVHNIFIDDSGYLYVTGQFRRDPEVINESVSIYNLNIDPENPERVWTFPAPSNGSSLRPAHDISVIRDKMYIFMEGRIIVFNVTDHSSPIRLGEYKFSNPNILAHSGWATEDDQYLFVCLEEDKEQEDVIILDISNPASPVEVGIMHDENYTIHNLYIIENYAYVSFYGAGLRIYDVTDPTIPSLIYEYDTNGQSSGLGAFGVYPFATSGNIYVSDVEYGLFIFKGD